VIILKKLLIIFLLLPICLFAQKKGHIEGIMYFEKDADVIYYPKLVEWLTANLNSIISIGGETIFVVPIERKYKKKLKLRLINGYLVQYEETQGNPNFITIFDVKTKVMEFDFMNKKINQKSLDNDDICFDKPDKEWLKIKIKEKDNKLKSMKVK